MNLEIRGCEERYQRSVSFKMVRMAKAKKEFGVRLSPLRVGTWPTGAGGADGKAGMELEGGGGAPKEGSVPELGPPARLGQRERSDDPGLPRGTRIEVKRRTPKLVGTPSGANSAFAHACQLPFESALAKGHRPGVLWRATALFPGSALATRTPGSLLPLQGKSWVLSHHTPRNRSPWRETNLVHKRKARL